MVAYVRAAAAAVSLEQSGVTGAEKALAGTFKFLVEVL
jgi:hypothetical protein